MLCAPRYAFFWSEWTEQRTKVSYTFVLRNNPFLLGVDDKESALEAKHFNFNSIMDAFAGLALW